MYESFYGLTGKPFQLNPDPQFYFASTQHRRAMAFVEYGLHQNEGFIVITGEVGAGKTTLVGNLLANLDTERVVAVHLVSTQLDADDILRAVAGAFGLRAGELRKAELLMSLEAVLADFATQGKRCLLIVDEAQNLTPRAVEELRMLSNFQLGTHALLQSFLIGQPEFRLILGSAELSQLRQRVIAACHIGPLDADETRKYIEHRLRLVGWTDKPLITDDAFEALHAASGGVPRRINLVCDRLMLSGFLADRRVFRADSVHEIAAEIEAETAAPASLMRRSSDVRPQDPQRAPAPGPAPRAQPGAPRSAYDVIDHVEAQAVLGQLQQVQEGMRDLQATMLRVERGNHATLGLFRRFLDWVRSNEDHR